MTAEQLRESEYITKARVYARMVWNGAQGLKSLQPEHTAQDYGTTLDTPTEGDNEGITKEQVGAAVFATADALKALFDTGHATNLTDLL